MKVENHTEWRTDDLRRFLRAALVHKGASLRTRFDVTHSRGPTHCAYPDKIGARAWVGFAAIRLFLPHPKHGPIDYRTLAQVLEHEIDHNLGLRHKDMLKWWDLDPHWQDGMAIRAKKEPRPKVPAVEQRAERARKALAAYDAKVAKAEKDLARYRKFRRKWAAKVRYYDVRTAARSGKGGRP